MFAGRVADTGRDPVPLMREALAICRAADRQIELLWASPRELLNIVQAAEIGCDIITVTNDLLAKLPTLGEGTGTVQPRDGADVPPRRRSVRVQAVSAGETETDGFVRRYLDETLEAVRLLDGAAIDAMATGLARVREGGGRLFILGVGGSAGHASHAVNDFRKICGFEAYAPTDNVSELTARVNDEGWETSFSEWLKVSRLGRARRRAGVLGGGRQPREKRLAQPGAGPRDCVAGRRGGVRRGGQGRGATRAAAEACVIIPTVSPDRITPHTEGLCAVVWHLLVSHPALKRSATKWESTR